jgi:hypothetical protein
MLFARPAAGVSVMAVKRLECCLTMPTPEQLKPLYREAFRTLDPDLAETPEVDVRFYPYVGINHTIRIRGGRIFVRVGELCRAMPLNEHKALAYILVAKLLRRRIPAEAKRVYDAYVKSHSVQDSARERRRARGKKMVTGSSGAFYDLDGIFEKVNSVYFGNRIARPVLSWSSRRTFRILGHHDPAHNTIVISRSLDAAFVPKFVVEFVMFHEMLHLVYPTVNQNGRRLNHTPQFRDHERRFLYFNEAERWISDNVRKLRRRAVEY